ncbi:hypothetical protein HXX76_011441 [Chlamydomonas incerta]|uniref:Uncharacterized protein n=1 Tax=Chlamydomonas incerta TaxID=51695 RepID=A0A835SKF7_CHLIN|nr:hypothetical protein HXX76_011441 [Chlamydomonas incerta]|eukprot:KAG2428738.1 hypothetical protein HXX76_011441 [Chlamydomonas incerta]
MADVGALAAAALGGHLPAVRELAARGCVRRNEQLREGHLAAGLRPLPAAAASGNLALVKWAMRQGAPPRPDPHDPSADDGDDDCGDDDVAAPGESWPELEPGRQEVLQACVLAAQLGHTHVVEWLCRPDLRQLWDPSQAAGQAVERGMAELFWPMGAAQVLAGLAGGSPLRLLQQHFDSLAPPLLQQQQQQQQQQGAEQEGGVRQLALSSGYPWRDVMCGFWARSGCAVRRLNIQWGYKEREAAVAGGRQALAPLLRAEVLAAAAASDTQWREKVVYLESRGWGPQDDAGIAGQQPQTWDGPRLETTLCGNESDGGGKVVERAAGLLLHRRLRYRPLLQATLRGGVGADVFRTSGGSGGGDSGGGDGGAGAGEEGRASDGDDAAERVAWLLARGYPLRGRALSMAALAGDVAALDVLLAAAASQDQHQDHQSNQRSEQLDGAGRGAAGQLLGGGGGDANPYADGLTLLSHLFERASLQQLCWWGHLPLLRRMMQVAPPRAGAAADGSSRGSKDGQGQGGGAERPQLDSRAGGIWDPWAGLTWRVRRLRACGDAMLTNAISGGHWELALWLVDNLCTNPDPEAEPSGGAAAAHVDVGGGRHGELHVCADLLAAVAARGAAACTQAAPAGGGGPEGGQATAAEGGGGAREPGSGACAPAPGQAGGPQGPQPCTPTRGMRDVVDMFGGITVSRSHFRAALEALDDSPRGAALLAQLRRRAGPACEERAWSAVVAAGNARAMRWLKANGIVPRSDEDLYGWALDHSDIGSLKQLAILGMAGGNWQRLQCLAEQLGDKAAARCAEQELRPLLLQQARDRQAAQKAGVCGAGPISVCGAGSGEVWGVGSGEKREGCGGGEERRGWWARLACCLRPGADGA